MTHWTPPNRGVTSDLKAMPTTSAFPLMGQSMGTQFCVASTDGGTLVSRSGMSKGVNPTAGGKAIRRNLPESAAPAGGVRVNRVYTNDPLAAKNGRNVYQVPAVFGESSNFRSER